MFDTLLHSAGTAATHQIGWIKGAQLLGVGAVGTLFQTTVVMFAYNVVSLRDMTSDRRQPTAFETHVIR